MRGQAAAIGQSENARISMLLPKYHALDFAELYKAFCFGKFFNIIFQLP